MTEDFSDARKSLKLAQVRVRSMEARLKKQVRPDFLTSIPHRVEGFNSVTERSYGTVLEATTNEKFSVYTFTYSVGVRAVQHETDGRVTEEQDQPDSDLEPSLEITVDFDVEYHSTNEIENSKLREFSKNHVGYHAWPYWREIVASSLSRLGLSSDIIQVPMYLVTDSSTDA